MLQLTTSDHCTLQYFAQGQGPTLIFLHGWSSSAMEWLPYAELLADRYRVICWSARGHGLQPHADDTDVSLDRMATDLHELLQAEAPSGAILVGHSMGALTAWNYIRLYGCDQLNGLCIIDQSPRLLTGPDWPLGIYGDFCHRRNREFQSRLEENFPDAVCRLIFSCLDQPESELPDQPLVPRLLRYLHTLPAELLTRCWQSLTEADLRPVLPTISCKTLLIYGSNSQFYSSQLAEWVAKQIPDSDLLHYAEADHSPHISHKQQFVADLHRFATGLTHRSCNETTPC